MSLVTRIKKDRSPEVSGQEIDEISTGNFQDENLAELIKTLRSLSIKPTGGEEVAHRVGPNGSDTSYCAVGTAEEGAQYGFSFRPANASTEVYSPNTSFPRHRRGQLERCDYWLGQDDMLDKLIGLKQEFTALGFSLRPQFKASTGSEESDKQVDELTAKLNRISIKWDFHKIIEDLLLDWFSKDTMILYWKTDPPDTSAQADSVPPATPEARSAEELMPGLHDICALNPAECDWQNSFGQDILTYRIPLALKLKIQQALSSANREAALQALRNDGVEDKYIEAVSTGKDTVELLKKDGDNWLVCTRARKRHGIAKPSMWTIFIPLEIRKALTEGEFGASYMMKHFILHVTTGESITQGVLAGQKNNWAKKPDIDALDKAMKNPAKAQRLTTNHTVKFNFIFPPADMWSNARYEKSESRILNWVGVSLVIFSGEGGTNAGGHLSIRRMISNMQSARLKIMRLFFEFFDNPIIRTISKLADDVDVIADFNENVLKEPKQILDEVTLIMREGMGDPAISLAELGRNPNTIRDSKRKSLRENKDSKVWEPVFQKESRTRQGERQVVKSGKGRPANPGTTPDEGTRTQSPPATD